VPSIKTNGCLLNMWEICLQHVSFQRRKHVVTKSSIHVIKIVSDTEAVIHRIRTVEIILN